MPPEPIDPRIRFERMVDRSGDCHLWTGATDKDGYGFFQVGVGELVRAHRWIWEQENGPIPDGMLVCHRCDTPPCVRLDDLFLGTHQDNVDDRDRKGRASSGEEHYAAKWTDEEIAAFRILVEEGFSISQAAKTFGISYGHAKNIIAGRKRAA